MEHREKLNCKRLLLTHMTEAAYDGLVLDLDEARAEGGASSAAGQL